MEPFKNLMSPELVSCTAGHLSRHVSGFDRQAFQNSILARLPELELKQRAQLIADHVHGALPENIAERNAIIQAMLHPDENEHAGEKSDEDGLCGWGIYPLTMVVGQHGLDDFDGSMALLKEMTKRGTAEFDIRYFLIADQPRALGIISSWVDDPNRHVRRLVSEGTRPRLPWGMQLKQLVADPAPTLSLMKALRDDEHEYVRRSVANHLNDIAKDHPDMVAELAGEWMKGADNNRKRLLRHACRSLIKQGHSGALGAFGIEPPRLKLTHLTIHNSPVVFGEKLEFSTSLTSSKTSAQDLVIDYIVHFKKANGALVPKVFKWKTMTLGAGQTIELTRNHAIRPITTRRYYAGDQALSLRINGRDFGLADFTLHMPEAG